MYFKVEEVLNHFDGDNELIGELIEVFEVSYPECLQKISRALDENNSKDLELHAHTLKGMIANFFAYELKENAFELEKMGRNNQIGDHSTIVLNLEEGLPILVNELKSII